MDKYPGTATVYIDRQQLIDHLTGSGALAYPWWHDLEINEDEDTVTVWITDPKADWASGEIISVTRTLSDLAAHMISQYTEHRGLAMVRGGVIDLDMDANDMDSVLQWAAFGKDIYA